jgi:hypothetical protein
VSEWNADNPQPFENLFDQNQREGREASAKWIDLVGRVADALEHYMIAQLLMQLQMQGFKVGPLPGIQHRVLCPGCNAIKSAKPDDRVVVPSGMPHQ